MNIWQTWKKLQHIAKQYDLDQQRNLSNSLAAMVKVDKAVTLIQERTEVHADVAASQRACSTIILCGRYKNHDYVRVVSVQANDFRELVDIVKRMEQFGKARFIDTPYGFEAAIKRDLSRDS